MQIMKQAAWVALAAVLATTPAISHAETKAQKEKRLHWWTDARLGMFIHWGVYSVPAGEWNGNTGYGEWIRESAHIPVQTYEKFRDQFNPVKFNADSWVKMAHDAGMKYIVITTKHHDGFDMFRTKQNTDWNIGATPYKKDVMTQMAAACKKYGLKMCWYHSIMDWHNPDYFPRRTWEAANRPPTQTDLAKFNDYLHKQVTELLTNYGPIGLMWFDGQWESSWNDKYGQELYDLCRKLQPNVIVNNRVGATGKIGDYSTPEQYIPPTGIPGVDWETCMTMNDNWGYNSHDKNFKSSETLIRNIVDIASKGGNYLLNIGPRSDGTFPPESVQRLKDIGKWMGTNGDSIYDTKASVFTNLTWGKSTTRREGGKTMLYLHVFNWPSNGKLVVPGLGNTPRYANLLSTGKRLKVKKTESDVIITLPKTAPDKICTTVALEVNGAPIVYEAPKIEALSDMLVTSVPVTLESGSKDMQVRYTTDGTSPNTKSTLYTKPFDVTETTTVTAASFYKGRRVSAGVVKTFTKTTPWPANGVFVGLRPALRYIEYKGSFEKLPDFDTLRGGGDLVTTDSIEIPMNGGVPAENVARRYMGPFTVPDDAVYVFSLTSDDGSKLWIDGKLVIDNDGLHASTTKTGAVPLAKGVHNIDLGWFNGTGGSALSLSHAKLGEGNQPIKWFHLGQK